MTELQCSVLVKWKTIPAHGGLHLRSVQKHVEFHCIYQEKLHVEASCFIESYNNWYNLELKYFLHL